MSLPFKIVFCSMVLLLCWPCQSQVEIPLGSMQNPPGVMWQKIVTPHFRIIFPKDIEADARHVANTLEHIYLPDAKTLQRNAGVWPLILHNQNTESNGFVTLAPRRSEWFNTPPQTGLIGVNPWYHVLAVHEFRHMVQFDATRTGLTKWLYYIMGDAGHLAGAFFSLPAWVWEGDATVNETLLTRGGRGRMPEFTMPIRTLLLNGKRYSYYKMMFGLMEPLLTPDARYRLYLDKKDTRSARKVVMLHDVLCNNLYDFNRAIVERVQVVEADAVEQLQLADLLVGAVCYASRGLSGSAAKNALVARIKERTGYALTRPTLLREPKFNLFIWRGQQGGAAV